MGCWGLWWVSGITIANLGFFGWVLVEFLMVWGRMIRVVIMRGAFLS